MGIMSYRNFFDYFQVHMGLVVVRGKRGGGVGMVGVDMLFKTLFCGFTVFFFLICRNFDITDHFWQQTAFLFWYFCGKCCACGYG